MTAPPMSRYELVWRQLKLKRELRIACPTNGQLRLRRGIIKRKNQDLGFKVLMAEEGKTPHLTFKVEGNIVTVRLHLDAGNLTVGLNL